MEDDTSEQLDGESFVVELPFEQVIFERIYDTGDGTPTTLVYGAITDEDNETVNPKPVIFYNHLTYSNSKDIGFRDDTDTKSQLFVWNNPLHGNTRVSPAYSTTFSREQNIWDFTYLENNLYTNHFKNYIVDTFNIKKREYKYTVYLPLNIITKLELNDLVIIKGAYYRIQKYSYNIITGKASFELINYFGTTAVGALRSSTQSVTADYTAQSILIYVFNLDGATYNKVDISGDGTSWISSTEDALTETGVLSLNFTAWTGSTLTRSMYLDITNKGETIRILIRQTPLSIFLTVDNDIITVDNDTITADSSRGIV